MSNPIDKIDPERILEVVKIETVKPCHKCGNTEPVFIDYWNDVQNCAGWWVKCGNTTCDNSNYQYKTKEKCLERWNYWNLGHRKD